MKRWISKYKNRIIFATVAILILAITFFAGSDGKKDKGNTASSGNIYESTAESAGESAKNKNSKSDKDSKGENSSDKTEAESSEEALSTAIEGYQENADSDLSDNLSEVQNQTENQADAKNQSGADAAEGNAGGTVNSETGALETTADIGSSKGQSSTSTAVTEKNTKNNASSSSGTTGNLTCTISISCSKILDNMSSLKANKKSIVPSDGWILKTTTVNFSKGETVFDALKRVCQDKGIPMEFSNTPLYNSAYIEGIYNLYEFDCGNLSGWVYSVNDEFPNYGCGQYTLSQGDNIKWMYTCDLGNDVK